MKAFAHLAPTAPAIFVAAIGMSLTVYLLHGAAVQGEPAPLLAVIGGAAGRVAADLPAAVNKPTTKPVGKAASYAQPATTRSVQFVPRRRTAATTAHRVHRSARSGVVPRASSVPLQAAAPAARATPVTASGHDHGRALKSTAGALAPRAHGHGNAHGHGTAHGLGKAFGHSSEHHHGLPRAHAKKAPTAPLSAPTTPPKVNGGGNGRKGGKK